MKRYVIGATATAKQEHVDSCVKGCVEDGGVTRGELFSRAQEIVPNVNKSIDPPGFRSPTTIKLESLLQKLAKTDLERGGMSHGKQNMEKGTPAYLKTGGLLEERTLPEDEPFVSTCLDIMNGVTVSTIINKKGETEVYPLLLVCQDTGAVHTEVAHGYSTGPLMDQWDRFVVKWGLPYEVLSDRGSHLAVSVNANPLNWEQVKSRDARRGTAWSKHVK